MGNGQGAPLAHGPVAAGLPSELAEAMLKALEAWARSVVAPGTPGNEASQLAAVALAEYTNRRRRDQYFQADMFAEPAWDMLLDLYVQHYRKRPVSVHSLCIAAAVPATTALRWITKLIDHDLVLRQPSSIDNRVIHVSLTQRGVDEMEEYLRERLQQRRTYGS